jgi:hypothetical protein
MQWKTVDSLGLTPEVDLHRLIERIHLSPTAPGWFADLVRSVTAKYGFDPNLVAQSELVGTPVY